MCGSNGNLRKKTILAYYKKTTTSQLAKTGEITDEMFG